MSRPDPMPTSNQATVFRRLRLRLLRNGLRVSLESGKIRFFTMIGTSALVTAFVFALSWYAFHELFQSKIPAKGMIVGGLFDLMFFTLGGMLLFSTGIILYASLFTSPESRYLLSTPAYPDRIFATRFQGAVGFSSWAFLILGLPILTAYGLVSGVPWYFYPLVPIYLFGFVLMPGSLSALFCIVLVRYLPKNRKRAMKLGGLVLAIVLGVWMVKISLAARQTLVTGNRNEVEGLIGQFDLVRHPLMPSHWMTNGLLAAARNEPREALLPLAVIWSNGLLAYLLGAWVASRLYRTAFDRITGHSGSKRVYRSSRLDRIMNGLVFYLDKPTRVLVVKDFRMFRRDPSQWVLLSIFAGMILIGAVNFRQYFSADLERLDTYIIGLINLFGTSVLLCAGLSRFIFPLISLEGRKFWVLGLTPISRLQILKGKFAFAATGAVLIALALVVGSELMLGMPWGPLAMHALTAVCVAVGLSGMNVGLGAAMPNFRETDPSKIVVGFNGTVNMVLGLLFLVVVVGLMAVPMHVAVVMKHFDKLESRGFPWWSWAGVPVGVVIACFATWLPLRTGARALKTTEF